MNSALPQTMRALLLTDSGPQVDPRYPAPQPAANEALLRVRMAGICATDLEITRGYKGGFRGVMGHEFVGEVVAVGDAAANPWLGKRVAGEINIGCGKCALCKRGPGKHCPNRSALGIVKHDGVFADFVTLPIENLHPIPDSVSDAVATFVEPLAAALQIAEQVHLRPSDRVAVLGDGRLGILIALVLHRVAIDTTLLGRTAEKLAIAASAGVKTMLTSALSEMDHSHADVVVEVTGSPQGFALARTLVGPGGTLVLKSTFGDALESFDASALVVDEITLVGSRCGPFAPAIALLASGEVDPAPLIHATYPLQDGVAALAKAEEKGVLKVLLAM